MRKLILAVLLFLLLLMPVWAQGPTWLPTVHKYDFCAEDDVSYWKVIAAEGTTNYVLNPSAETTGNFAAGGGGTMTRPSTYSKYGLYSYRIQTAVDNQGGDLTLSALSNAVHYATLRVRGTLPSWDWSLDGATYNEPSLIEQLDSNWALYGCSFPAAQATGSTTLEIRQNGAGAGDFYVDGAQVEEKSYWTTYVDGDQQGCEWNGAEHASTSTRSAGTTAGGRQYDLQDDYYFDVGGMIGLGTAPQSVVMDEYAILPGGELNTIKVPPRPFTLTGVVRGSSYSDMHNNLNDLEGALLPSFTQPVRLRYTGSTVHKEIAAFYRGGMEGNVQASDPCYWQRMAVRLIAPDPYFYDYGGSGEGGAGAAILLDTNDSATFRIVAGRLKDTGQWDELGPPGAPGTAVYTFIHAIAEDDTYYYLGGDFTNFNNDGNADYIVRYNKDTGAWSALGTGMDGIVYALIIASDGTLYVGGSFTTAGGGAAAAIAQWDPVGEAWAAVGAGLNLTVYALAVGHDGNIYAGGAFTDLQGGGLAAANYIACWDPIATTWSALATGFDDFVRALAIGLDGTLFAGGDFLNAGAVPVVRVAQWDGSAWSALEATGLNDWCYALVVNADGILYAGGGFTTAGGATVNYIAQWNGTAWYGMDDGMDDDVWGLSIGPDGIIYAAGDFTQAGPITLANKAAKWNGSTWAHLDIDFPGNPSLQAIWASGYSDPIIEVNYDLIVGFNTSGTGYFAGSTNVTNNGTEEVFPIIIFERSDGTSATIYQVRNETTGKTLLFDYALSDGERLTIDLRPTQQSIVSSMFGSRPDAILANSDMGDFVLQPGDNLVTAFVNVVGNPTVTAWMEWRTRYRGL